MLIAVPSEAPGGLDAAISDHFGHCAAFTLVSLDEGGIGEVRVVANVPHSEGGCLAPVRLLEGQSVQAMVAGGIGMRPLAGFQSVGIKVFHKGDTATVREAAMLVATGGAQELGEEQTCGGGGHCGGHGHHHAKPVVREPISGKADVQPDRVVTFHYDLRDADGELIESTQSGGPVFYLHGHGNIMPGLEAALLGLEANDEKRVELSAADAYGERDESRTVEIERARLPRDIEVGSVVRGQRPGGGVLLLTAVEVGDETVKFDANHPLAGKALIFDVKVVKVEAATAEEVQHGHTH